MVGNPPHGQRHEPFHEHDLRNGTICSQQHGAASGVLPDRYARICLVWL